MNKKRIRVLLIDDEEEFANTLAERLELRGYDTKTAVSGEDGLNLMNGESFDIAVLDLMMPGMNGLDTLRRIKSQTPDLPVVLLTGHGSTKEGMEGMRLGAFDYLMKPLDIKDLTLKILSAVDASDGNEK
ncbi:Response regulator receiver domain-containing protein [Desulfocicer vacuolatum DSM 3385]|uniref:Response regulator receiver domain-containing protein n=1 Tax=Desulfocicer vacuolatum DSM 3385 TaxID=1121400 RepID=A0A1W2DC49_9BACT|nr:response regulator [Desulfocicer vacuolatum]SMC94712.1 Response regulator receiver domain-containing protein [Desulfocicer vacuolatum DSM 3385]